MRGAEQAISALTCLRNGPLLSTLAFPCFDGIYLPKQENKFLHQVMEELETYQQKNNRRSVLLFPPLPSRLRYLIHKTIEDVPELSTFSVGESWCRRVVVCHSELRAEVEEDSDLECNSSSCEEPVSLSEETDAYVRPKAAAPKQRRGPKRPDKPLYMPRAARDRLSSRNSQAAQESPSSAHCGSNSVSSSSDSCSCPETAKDSSAQEAPPGSAEATRDCSVDGAALCPQEGKDEGTLRLQEDQALLLEQTRSSFAEMTVEESEEDKKDAASDHGNTEDASTDTDDVTEEIKLHLKDALTVSIEHVHQDYSLYENVCINAEGFGHVIEIYDFPAVFKTEHLLDAFTEYSDGGMKIKWVDNTHALGVFSSESAALQALSICHPLLKVRPLAEGSKKAQGKALRRAEFIQPVKERPRTDCAVARRMVTRALGIRGRGRRQQLC